MIVVLFEWEIIDVDQVNDIMDGKLLCLLCYGLIGGGSILLGGGMLVGVNLGNVFVMV